MKTTSKTALAALMVSTLVAAAPAQAASTSSTVQPGFWGSLVTALHAALSSNYGAAVGPCNRAPTQG